MAKIGIFVKNLTSGGAERQATYLAVLLSAKNDVRFIIFNGEKVHQKYVDYLVSNNVRIDSFSGDRKSRWKDFKRYVKEESFDVIFSYLTAANLYAVRAAKKTPTKVVTGIRNARLPLPKLLADCVITDFLADSTVANCYCGAEYFTKRGFKKSKMKVIPNCIFISDDFVKQQPDDTIEVISVARFVPQKDYPTAIKAFAAAHKVNPKLRYSIVGYGEDETLIRELIKTEGCEDCITIALNPSDIPQRLRRAQIYLSTSLFEGTSNSIMEAMDAKLPVVATNVGDNARVVADGKTGYIVNVKDSTMICEKLLALANEADLRQKMGDEGRLRLVEEYSTEIFTKRYQDLIGSLINA